VSPVRSHTGQPRHPGRERHFHHMLIETLERLFELRAKVAERGVVGLVALGEPHEVDVMTGEILHLASGADPRRMP
jgi:hypothetical protein